MGSLHLKNQVTVQERRATEFSIANAQLWKTLVEAHTRETKLEAEAACLREDLLAACT